MQFFFVIILVASLTWSTRADDRSLRALAVLFRHGDRLPEEVYPGDPHANLLQSGLGNLTTGGCIRVYNNGLAMRENWPQLANVTNGDYFADSVDRCIQSTQCLRAALTQDSSPVDSGEKASFLLGSGSSKCMQYPDGIEEVARKVYEKYSDTLDELSRITGTSFSPDMASLGQALSYFDSIDTENFIGLPLPPWFTSQFKNQSDDFLQDNFGVMKTLPISRAFSVSLLDEIFGQLSSSPEDTVSLYAYCTHDTTLASVLNTLNVAHESRPSYAESLIFTLSGDGQLQFHFLNMNHLLQQLSPADCRPGDCSLQQFSDFLSTLTPFDPEGDC